MTIEKAIEILEKAVEATNFVPDHPLRHAQELGIEALKAVQKARRGVLIDNVGKLPGETKE